MSTSKALRLLAVVIPEASIIPISDRAVLSVLHD
jgi:hypothetical protein